MLLCEKRWDNWCHAQGRKKIGRFHWPKKRCDPLWRHRDSRSSTCQVLSFCFIGYMHICIIYICVYIYIVKKQNSSPFRIEWVVVQGSYLIRFLNAQVVSIFKKGDTENIANYRPISLLNAIYKVFAEIIRQRLSDAIDPYICNTQFGFRKNCSTTDALFIARRLQDLGERSGDNIVICMLDWKQAFDRISHPRMMQALERLNLPRKFRHASFSFQVKHEKKFCRMLNPKMPAYVRDAHSPHFCLYSSWLFCSATLA